MRITQLLTFNGFQKKMNENREALARFQEQLSTGQRVVKPSDDSIAFGTSRQLKEAARQTAQYQSNIKTGLSNARTAQEAMNGMIDILIDFKSTVINGSTDTLTDTDRESLADKVASLKDKIVDLGNTQFNGTYLFAGTNTQDPPFSEDAAATGMVDDTSNAKALKTRVSASGEVETTITGTELRSTPAGDLFGVMQRVEDALRANDRTALGTMLDDVDESVEHVTGLTARLGSNINRLEFVSGQLESQSIEQEGEISRLIDADYAETITNFRKHETAYQAALAVHSRISDMSLLNFI